MPALEEALPLQASEAGGLLGVTSEAFSDALCSYVRQNPDGLLRPQVCLPGGTGNAGAWEEFPALDAPKLQPLQNKRGIEAGA